MNAPLPVEPRLLAGSLRNEATGCLVWQRGKCGERRSYGVIRVNGVLERVHVVAHELWVGPVPEGYHVDHVWDNGCRSSLCIEPKHLEAVTPLENMRRTAKARKTHCIRNHPLSGENVRIRNNGTRACRTCNAPGGRTAVNPLV